jgi:ABC-type amino acid transport system permease subunit
MINRTLIERARIISLVIALIGGALKLSHVPGANICLIIGISTLGLCHIIMGFDNPVRTPKAVYVNYSRNFSIAVLLFGLLYYLMHWPGARIMLISGVGGVVFSAILQFMWNEPGEGGNN